jgi:hypothetical protein
VARAWRDKGRRPDVDVDLANTRYGTAETEGGSSNDYGFAGECQNVTCRSASRGCVLEGCDMIVTEGREGLLPSHRDGSTQLVARDRKIEDAGESTYRPRGRS